MQKACDSCKKVDYLFSCSECGWASYCSPRCQTNDIPFHEKDCKNEAELIKNGCLTSKDVISMYKPFVDNEKVHLFMAGFSYCCSLKNEGKAPECTVSIEERGVYLALMKDTCPPDVSDVISRKQGHIPMSLGYDRKKHLYAYDCILFPIHTAKGMYSLYKDLFDIASNIQFQVYNSSNRPEGLKEDSILVIFNNKKGGKQQIAFL